MLHENEHDDIEVSINIKRFSTLKLKMKEGKNVMRQRFGVSK